METLLIESASGKSKYVRFECSSKTDIAIIAGYVAGCKDHGCKVMFNPESRWFTPLKNALKRLRK